MALLAGADTKAGDILRGGATLGQKSSRGATTSALPAGAETARLNARDTLARTTAAITSVKAMQDAARAAAIKGPNNLGADPRNPGRTLPNVPDGLVRGGLQVAPGVPRNLASPQTGEDAKLWQGALLPKQQVKNGRTLVTIEQTKPQAMLNWQTFNVGKKTTLNFSAGRGGADKTQWIAFNKVNDPSASPSQILGEIKGEGQVYIINPNGILFGGSSQINLHALVASSLPINDTLVNRGLLNNTDLQFLFAAPTTTDTPPGKLPVADSTTQTFSFTTTHVAMPGSLVVSAVVGSTPRNLTAGKDYTVQKNAAGNSVLTFTDAGIKRYSGLAVSINYVSQQGGDIVVQKGARLTSPTSASSVGGRVALIGPNVRNQGTISTPDGQTILAAGYEVALVAHPSSEPKLRGLDVSIGRAGASSGVATNTGLIDVPRANATIAGREVHQLGTISSTTSVDLNGSVVLQASYGAASVSEGGVFHLTDASTGLVEMGDGSVTQILPEVDSTKTVVGTSLSLRSTVKVTGHNLHFGGDSILFAPNGDVTLNAGDWGFTTPGAVRPFTYTSGQIYLDPGATINVAGTTDVAVAIAQNILSLEFRGAELADSPLQRTGPLRATTINLDIRKTGTYNGKDWVGTPLGDATGYAGLIQRTVAELTTGGGTVTMHAGNSVVMQPGSKVDVSGGYINFQGGMVNTSRVISQGQIMDIANATPDRPFSGIYDGTYTNTSPKYGFAQTWTNPLSLGGAYFDPGYVSGQAGGSIAITAASMALDGTLAGNTITGPRQRTAKTAPPMSALSLDFQKQDPDQLNVNTGVNTFFAYSPTPPSITFGAGSLASVGAFSLDATGNANPLPAERLAQVILSPKLFTESGFGSLTVNNPDGDITIPQDTPVKLPARGSLTLTAANMTIAGDVSAPGGNLAFATSRATPFQDHKFAGNPKTILDQPTGRGTLEVKEGSHLSVAGLIVDDRPLAAAPLSLPMAIDGGNLALRGYNVLLEAGSSLDASGGVAFAKDSKRTYGAGGSISIKAGNDPVLPAVVGGTLQLDAQLSALSGAKGGSLTIQAPSVIIGGTAAAPQSSDDTLTLPPSFFSQGGFSNFTIIGLGVHVPGGGDFDFKPAVEVEPGTLVNPVALNWNALPYSGDHGPRLVSVLQPQALRTPVSITLSGTGQKDDVLLVTRADVIIGEGARIETDPGGSIAVIGDSVSVLGALVAPAGSVSVTGITDQLASKFAAPEGNTLPGSITNVYLGPNSLLSAKGAVVFTPNPFGFHTGNVLPGGKVSVAGNIVAVAGAVLDVSGTTGIVDVPAATVQAGGDLNAAPVVQVNSGVNRNLYQRQFVPTRIDGDAGEISLAGGTHLFTDATLLGQAGGPTALGGTLTISSGRFYLGTVPDAQKTPLDVTLQVTQGGSTLPAPIQGSPIGVPVPDLDGKFVQGLGHFAVDSFTRGGFDSLNLRNTVEFVGPVTINARRTLTVASNATTALQVSTGGVIYADDVVTLNAPYITLGTSFLTPHLPGVNKPPFQSQDGFDFHMLPSFGAGQLKVNAGLIDVGNLSLQHIGSAEFVAEGGDIRGDGTLSAAGSILLRAAQIYPPTAVSFTISAADYTVGGNTLPGSVTIEGAGTRELPLSAGGQLNIYGSIITQGGTVRAPLGGINLGWDGSGDAPINPITGVAEAATRMVTLSPGSMTSVSAISPINGQPLTIPFGINVNGVTWFDPAGTDITAGGVAQKTVNIAGLTVNSMAGSQIDIRGGGDLYSYRWVAGIGGSKDVLGSSTSFAIVPSYGANYAPFAPFNSDDVNKVFSTTGYVNATLKVGDRIHLGATQGLPEGDYTLLPARYALLPGAFLVTPKAGTPLGNLMMPDGSELVPGYRFNDLNSQREVNPQLSWFEVLTADVMRQRSQYADYYANDFLFTGALSVEANVPRLPRDAGHLTLQASEGMTLRGTVAAQAPNRSRGGLVDIASPVDILITANGGSAAGKLVLSAAQLNSFGAESLLIGGIRQENGHTAQVTVKTGNLTVDNAGTPLKGSEIILVANQNLTLADGASVVQEGKINGQADFLVLSSTSSLKKIGDTIDFGRPGTTLLFPNGTPGDDRVMSTSAGFITNADGSTSPFAAGVVLPALQPGARVTLNNIGTLSFSTGSAPIPLSLGDGAMVRVSSDANAQSTRQNVASSSLPNLTVGAGVRLSGGSITLDSTSGTSLDSSAILDASSIALNSGQVSIQLDPAQAVNATTGLVLSGTALQSLSSSQSLSLLSYSTLDIYGGGEFSTAGWLALHAGAILGHNNGSTARISAGSILLDNAGNAAPAAAPGATAGMLELHAGAIGIGKNPLAISQFDTVSFDASAGIVASGNGGLIIQKDFQASTPVLTAARSATQFIKAGGNLTLLDSGVAGVSGGLGASLTLEGSSVTSGTNIVLSSGLLKIHATTGDLAVNGGVNLSGTVETLYDLVRYTSGGRLELTADNGSVVIGADSLISVSAPKAGGNAGTLLISAPKGSFNSTGKYSGEAGAGGMAGTFVMDVGTLPSTSALEQQLLDGGFTESQSFRIRTGDVSLDGTYTAHHFAFSTDAGGITVNGNIDASGVRGGSIELDGSTFVTLANGSTLSVEADEFDAAGKGGSIFMNTGTAGTIHVQAGSNLLLGGAIVNDPAHGHFTGTLHLRAPQINGDTDVAISTLAGNITSASSIVVEGYKVVTLSGANVTITQAMQTAVLNAGNKFVGVNGTPSATYAAMLNRILGGQTNFSDVLSIRPGTEFVNANGSITLGAGSATTPPANNPYQSDWNLATFRFGPQGAPGLLTIRASGNLTFWNSLSDGFQTADFNANLLNPNGQLPLNAQSWSFQLVAGADTAAADASQVRPLTSLAVDSGSFILGHDSSNSAFAGTNPLLSAALAKGFYQVVRTGSGNIEIAAGRDVQIHNELSSIYTAGTLIANPTVLPDGGSFDVPNPSLGISNKDFIGPDGRGGVIYPAQYTVGGGNILITAQNDIAHFRRALVQGQAVLASDSSRELPINWLYRRSNVAADGTYLQSPISGGVDSTTWWVDFSNFFEGVGALGGGNVTMLAGRDVANVDAVSVTNARAPKGQADAAKLLELGGGDVTVRAGRNIDGGVYYVERGHGTLAADGSITTNQSRGLTLGALVNPNQPDAGAAETWLPTTLFLGKGGFDVSARGDVLLGPTANPFLLPAGFYNAVRYKTYFSTYAPDSYVNVTSLGGNVNLRLGAATPNADVAAPMLQLWLEKQMVYASQTAGTFQPWLLIDETTPSAFATAASILPGTLRLNAFSGEVNIVGNLILGPSPSGNLEIAAAKAVNGLNPIGVTNNTRIWNYSRILVSDASPARVPSIENPLGVVALTPANTFLFGTVPHFLDNFDLIFSETGQLDAGLDAKQAWHAPGLLHSGDADPVRIYAGRGDVSGLTVITPKFTHILAGRDIADVALYIQDVSEGDISIVAAGRDITAFSATSPRRGQAQTPGNQLALSAKPLLGDLQIAGPGTLEVLAGRNIDLGPVPTQAVTSSSGLALGIVSVGNARNTFLPFSGADLVVGAGIGHAASLGSSSADFESFIAAYVAGPASARYQTELTAILGGTGSAADFENLDPEKRSLAALQIFYLVLRDAGRDFNVPDSPGFGNYDAGFAAIGSLFPDTSAKGDISLTSREIKTKNGGSVNILAPGGRVVVGFDVNSAQALDQGILTESGGNINIFANGSVTLGTSRIFTLRGGNEIIWSSTGDIAAGVSSKTVQSAPPTRVLIDPQSADVKTDLAGLATGGGIGVLTTVVGVPPGNVDLVAPAGAIDAGDAGIRSSGNLNIAAKVVLNAENIQVTGTSVGAPASAPPAAPVLSVAPPPPPPAASTGPSQAEEQARQQAAAQQTAEIPDTIFTGEVLGYGGGDGSTGPTP